MTRQIKFKAKRLDGGDWVTGYCYIESGMTFIIPQGLSFLLGGSCRDLIEVDPATVMLKLGDADWEPLNDKEESE